MNEPPENPAKQKNLRAKHIVVEVVICVLAALSVPTLWFALVLVPIAYAYPITVSKPKLLLIPTGMAAVGFIVLLYRDTRGSGLASTLLILFVVTSVIGILAGLLYALYRDPNKRTGDSATIRLDFYEPEKRADEFAPTPPPLKPQEHTTSEDFRELQAPQRRSNDLVCAIAIIILLIPFLFVMDLITGVIRSPFVHLRIHTYVARNYGDFDLAVRPPRFHYAFQTFNSRVYDRNNPSNSFTVSFERGQLSDTFTGGHFWARMLSDKFTPLLEQEFGGVFRGFSSTVRNVQAGQSFGPTANVNIYAIINITADGSAAYVLAAQISQFHAFFARYGFNFVQYGFIIRYPNIEGGISITLRPDHIDDELAAMIEYARENRNHNNVFSRNNFRYESRWREE